MIKKTYTYVDYNGNERKEDYYFNLTETEVIKLQYSKDGGLSEKIQRIIDAQNVPEIMKTLDEIISLSYGVKSPDGREFVKSPEITRSFMQTEGYNKFFMDFVSKDGFAAEFINALLSNVNINSDSTPAPVTTAN